MHVCRIKNNNIWINVDLRVQIQFTLILSGIGYAVGTFGWVISILPGTVILYFKYKHELGLLLQWKGLSLGEKRTQQKEKKSQKSGSCLASASLHVINADPLQYVNIFTP